MFFLSGGTNQCLKFYSPRCNWANREGVSLTKWGLARISVHRNPSKKIEVKVAGNLYFLLTNHWFNKKVMREGKFVHNLQNSQVLLIPMTVRIYPIHIHIHIHIHTHIHTYMWFWDEIVCKNKFAFFLKRLYQFWLADCAIGAGSGIASMNIRGLLRRSGFIFWSSLRVFTLITVNSKNLTKL